MVDLGIIRVVLTSRLYKLIKKNRKKGKIKGSIKTKKR